MLKYIASLVIVATLIVFSVPSFAAKTYGSKICSQPGYRCHRVKRRDSWERLFPNEHEREIVKRLNRTNMRMRLGTTIAIPKNLANIDHMDISPFPHRIEPRGRKFVLINMRLMAFGAYDEYGYLAHWGPMSGGRGWCSDLGKRCNTPRGEFQVYRKGSSKCVSKKFPIGVGGAPMYYCMFFYGGYAMHASTLPGKHASHGCIRLFKEDAQWLNQNFISTGRYGTPVIIQSSISSPGIYMALQNSLMQFAMVKGDRIRV